jgi:hypothetical protein
MAFNLFSWIFKQASSLEKLIEQYFSGIKKYVALAVPIVEEVSLEVGAVAALTQDQALIRAGVYIETITKDTQAVTDFLNAHATSLVPDLLHAVAVYASTVKIPDLAKLAVRDLDAIIQLAYSSVRSADKV